jgi:hypothetical protein
MVFPVMMVPLWTGSGPEATSVRALEASGGEFMQPPKKSVVPHSLAGYFAKNESIGGFGSLSGAPERREYSKSELMGVGGGIFGRCAAAAIFWLKRPSFATHESKVHLKLAYSCPGSCFDSLTSEDLKRKYSSKVRAAILSTEISIEEKHQEKLPFQRLQTL